MALAPETPADRFHAQLAAAHSVLSPESSALTPLSPSDSHTLTTYLFTHNANLPAAAAALEIRATDLNTFLHLPHIAAHLASLEAAQTKHDIRAALDTLKHAATTPDSPAEPRRAATAILRFYNAPSRATGSAGSAAVPVSTPSTSPRPTTDTASADRDGFGAASSGTKEHACRATEIALNLGGSQAPLAHSGATGSAGSAAELAPTSPTSPRPTTDNASRTTTAESTATDASKSPAPSDPSDLSDPPFPPDYPTNLTDLPAWLEARRAEHEATSKRYHDEAQEMLRELAYASARRRGVDLSKEDPIATYVFRGKLLSPIINKRINRSRPPPRYRYRIPCRQNLL